MVTGVYQRLSAMGFVWSVDIWGQLYEGIPKVLLYWIIFMTSLMEWRRTCCELIVRYPIPKEVQPDVFFFNFWNIFTTSSRLWIAR
ncbi:hypothetical protein NPIL_564091 [Nephila pilipes]|uniref:Uncharacterized protein n=1 Tax=Nephila pilipes TaxID=299642 RepID=A0A8X6U108_NEPPI|nr:hypothetical protein NPIL_564091 [Nephila pilipes]